jgi:hypothetical protein
MESIGLDLLEIKQIDTTKLDFSNKSALNYAVSNGLEKISARLIDILVDLDYSQKIGLGFVQMQLDLEKLLNIKVDLVSSNGLSKYIQPIVDREKQLIYAR